MVDIASECSILSPMKTLSLVVVLVACVALPVLAKDKDNKPKKDAPPPSGPSVRGEKPGAHHVFTVSEREIIVSYVKQYGGEAKGKKGKGLPPGLAKKAARGDKLPPGWEANIVRGQIVPVQIFQQVQPVPRELAVRLPAPPVGTITVAIDGRLVRLVEATREILDVFELLP